MPQRLCNLYLAAPNILKAEIEKQIEDIEEDLQKPLGNYKHFYMNLLLYFYLILYLIILELFSDKDVSGSKLYGFQTPVKKNSMILKANQCRMSNTETPKSLKTLPNLKVVLEDIMLSPENKNLKDNKEDVDRKGIIYFIEQKFCYKL